MPIYETGCTTATANDLALCISNDQPSYRDGLGIIADIRSGSMTAYDAVKFINWIVDQFANAMARRFGDTYSEADRAEAAAYWFPQLVEG